MSISNWDALLSHGNRQGRRDVIAILEAGLRAADPYDNVRALVRIEGDRLLVGNPAFDPLDSPWSGTDVYDLSELGRIWVFGAGKGVQRAAQALEDALGERLTGGHIIDKKGGDPPYLSRIEVTLGSHPAPDEDCVRGSRRILEMTRDLRADDLVFTIGASGFSSLLTLPAPGVSLEDVQRTVYMMQIERGAPTSVLSPIRNHVDLLKGGLLAAHLAPARAIHLLAKEPRPWRELIYENTWIHTFPDCSTFADAIANLKAWDAWEDTPPSVRAHLLRADPAYETVKPERYLQLPHRIFCVFDEQEGRWVTPRAKAEELGYRAVLLATGVGAEAVQAGRYAAAIARTIERYGHPFAPPVALITGGEMLVTVGQEKGIGGRNQEWALAGALEIAGSAHIVMGAVDTDGTDGPGAQYLPEAAGVPTLAGGVVDGYTMQEARERGVDLREALRRHNTTEPLLALDSGILATQSTGLQDLGVILVTGRSG
jgi:glycerate 2-kinase